MSRSPKAVGTSTKSANSLTHISIGDVRSCNLAKGGGTCIGRKVEVCDILEPVGVRVRITSASDLGMNNANQVTLRNDALLVNV
jgi:hypothetical protein